MEKEITINGELYVKKENDKGIKIFGTAERRFMVYSDGRIDCCDKNTGNEVHILGSLNSLYEAVELSKKRSKEK